MTQHIWTDSELSEANALLNEMTLRSAAETLTKRWGRHIHRDALKAAIARAFASGRLVGRPGHDTIASMPAAAEVELADDSEPNQEERRATLDRLVGLTARGPRSLEELCDELELPPSDVRELVGEARGMGYRVEIDGAHVGTRPPEPPMATRDVPVAGGKRIVAVVGDVHFGNKHHKGAYFEDFCRYAYNRGVRTFLQVGDLLDGNYRHSVWEQSHRGYEDQVACAIDSLPQMPDATWYFIQGNHDETLGEHNGLDVGRCIERDFREAGRTDLVYLGARGAYAHLTHPDDRRGLFVELWHPRDRANAYAKSYRLQKHIEMYAPGMKPDAVFAGHWHTQMYFEERGVHAFAAGCWQGGQSSFGKSLGGAPKIGSWIVEYSTTDDGAVRTILPEWRTYQEVETVRDIALG